MTLLGIPEPALRLIIFLATLPLLMGLELWIPRRTSMFSRLRRWPTNMAMVTISAVVVRAMGVLAPPLLAAGMSLWAARHGVGLLNHLGWPAWLEFSLGMIALDLLIWAQHRAFHHVPLLWRIHRVHHADRDFDATTALRFHPLEIVVSMLIKVVAILLLGLDATTVVAFEIVLSTCAMFNHANLYLPEPVDRMLRVLIVTPDLHRVHHSADSFEHNANFGFNLSIWDRLFGTYVAQPRSGHRAMTIGLRAFQGDRPTSLWWSLALPFSAAPDRPAGAK
jgi:sterol desaturase/sphingolipid hydroxylase (fatty acid hydroxylase superfamily)